MSEPCKRCAAGAAGDKGHEALAFYVMGPYPGHHIFNCVDCGERWIRHAGDTERHGWTRYAERFPIRRPRPSPVHRVVSS